MKKECWAVTSELVQGQWLYAGQFITCLAPARSPGRVEPSFVFEYRFISFFSALLGCHLSAGLSLVAEGGGCPSLQRTSCSLVALASLVERRLQGTGALVIAAPGLWSAGSAVVGLRLSCFRACGISQVRDGARVSCIGRQTITEPPGEF